MIHVSNLTKEYGNRRAVNEISFKVEKGEIVGFLGPNGAGKTTTMRILTGYIPPSSGKAKIGGYDIMEQSIHARRLIGYMPETVPLHQDMTVYEYLKFMADLRKVKNAKQRVNEVLAQLHLEERASGYISKLSKGLKQRVGLAQAILHQPEVLILDEPTIGLDPAQIIEVRNLIRQIGKQHTVLLSTHILPEAQQVCNRVLIINKGNIVAEDTTEHLQARLAGSQRVILRVRGEIAPLLPRIEQLPGVLRISRQNDDTLEFETPHAEDARPQAARATIEAGFDLLELHAVSLSLEEIFLQLTHEDAPVPITTSEPAEQ